MDKLKKEYNDLLIRINNAEKFFKTCSDKDVEKHLPLMIKICNESCKVLNELKRLGHKATIEEVEGGFKLEN